ncbi:MAG: hypothetical protein K8R92_08565 [Planctomycetes bacterium]|nr:hypothetical protein [Planctomycetota bacterium]
MTSKRTTATKTKSRAKSASGARSADEASRTAEENANRAAREEFLKAVKSFASTTTKEFREDLGVLVARAQRTGSKLAESASKTYRAADGRILEFSGEAARDGLNAVRRKAGGWATTAGGFLEGLAKAIAPAPSEPVATVRVKPAVKKSVKKKVAKSASRTTAKRR